MLITGSMLIVLGLVFVLGLQCGIEGAYGAKAVGASSSVGAFTALCNLREVIPYAFGYMMAAKVGTGIVAELGSMRISDEIDALEVMGLDSVAYLCSTRLLGCGSCCRSSTSSRSSSGSSPPTWRWWSRSARSRRAATSSSSGSSRRRSTSSSRSSRAWRWRRSSSSSASTTATTSRAGRSGSAGRRPSRWSRTSSASTSSGCSGRRSSGAATREPDRRMSRSRGPTAVAVALLVAALVLVVLIVSGLGSDSYTVTARFTDAGQLVKGDLVQVGGRTVGTVKALKLADNGQADVEMKLTDDSVRPAAPGHAGDDPLGRPVGRRQPLRRPEPRATPRCPRSPTAAPSGPTARAASSTSTSLLDSLDPKVRGDVQGIIRDAATALTPQRRQADERRHPSLQPRGRPAHGARPRADARPGRARLAASSTASSLAGVLARHREALGGGIESTAGVLTAVASERDQLAAALAAAPESLRTTTATLRRLRTQTLPAVDPVLEGARAGGQAARGPAAGDHPDLAQRRAARRQPARAHARGAPGARCRSRVCSGRRRPRWLRPARRSSECCR